ncbi:MAG: hypothetical protein EBY17_28735 [Acidobacteriia bacterium]|nr:hypothetical protein [Terriglobia bacterium]
MPDKQVLGEGCLGQGGTSKAVGFALLIALDIFRPDDICLNMAQCEMADFVGDHIALTRSGYRTGN